jgi:hypothetical protein
MKMKHNKKRNTAFIYEVLIRELTKAMMENNVAQKKVIINLVREHFRGRTLLAKDLESYKAILETREVDRHTAEKMIFEARAQKSSINHRHLFEEQSVLIDKINTLISPDVFGNFVPNYKDLATVFQIFNPKVKTKNRVLLEKQMVHRMLTAEEQDKELMRPIDTLTYKTFVKKFNEKYATSLLESQKELLNRYVTSFADNGLELKVFLNEEIPRLLESVKTSLELPEVKADADMRTKTQEVIGLLESTSKRQVDNTFIHDILKIQNLVEEY